jgi:hypothetical protein
MHATAKLLGVIALLLLLMVPAMGGSAPLDQWTPRNPLPIAEALYSVAFGNGQFVALGDAGTIMTSQDGVNWTLRQWGNDTILSGIAYGNGQFVAVGQSEADGSDVLG